MKMWEIASPHPSPRSGEGAEGEAAPTRLFYDGYGKIEEQEKQKETAEAQ